MSLILESQGYSVRTAQDGEEGWEKIEENEPDLLILDLLMPRMDGFEVCKKLEERRSSGRAKFPVIILSAVYEENSRRRYELETETELQVDDYVTNRSHPRCCCSELKKPWGNGKQKPSERLERRYAWRSRPRFCLIDDDPVFVEAIKAVLESEYRVVTAYDGEEV